MFQARVYVLAALGLAVIGGLGFGGRALYKAGYNAASLDHIKDVELIERASLASQKAAAEAISSMKVQHVTIRQNLEKELTRDVIYRDCVANDRVLGLTNQALTGAGTDTSASSVVPEADPAD